MRKTIASVVLILILMIFVSCGTTKTAPMSAGSVPAEEEKVASARDYASEVKLRMNSDSLKQEVSIHSFVDGDTTHFNVPTSIVENGILKARYLAINTPESTGVIEEYGKKASAFTREKLSHASSIIIESDNDKWNLDSTGGRYLVWVWYRNNDSEDYRNLNIEILQNGLAIASNTAGNRYGSTAMAALNSAKERKLNVYSGEKDPDFYYGDAVEMTLKELRLNVEKYNGIKVAFEGVITMNDGGSVYVEDFDPDTGLYYGISVFYGYNLPGKGLDILSVGNRSRIVGTAQYYEAGEIYQVSGLAYKQMKPNDPGNIQKISDGHSGAFVLTDVDTFTEEKVSIPTEEGTREFSYGYLALDTTIEMHNLHVESIHTEDDATSSNFGAMTLHCEVDGVKIRVRTAVLTDENRSLITEDAYLGKTINVRGVVDFHNGAYQIKVLSAKDITII